jgi:hypothetical protein
MNTLHLELLVHCEARRERQQYLHDRNLFDDRLCVCLAEYRDVVEARQRMRQDRFFRHVVQELNGRAMAHPNLHAAPIVVIPHHERGSDAGIAAMVFLSLCMLPLFMTAMGVASMVDGIAEMRVKAITVSKRAGKQWWNHPLRPKNASKFFNHRSKKRTLFFQ